MKLMVIMLIVALEASALGQGRRATHELDTVGYPAVSTRADVSSSFEGYVEGRTDIRGPLQLKVTLESVSPTGAAYADRVIYDILIENRDRRSVLLPWSPEAGLRSGALAGTLPTGSIVLVVQDSKGQRLTEFGFQPLAGSAGRAGSVQLLAPGETARIRAAGEWRTSERGLNAVLSQPGSTVRLAALFTIDSVASVLSDNSIEVLLRGPKKK